jgi:hypothetical protein
MCCKYLETMSVKFYKIPFQVSCESSNSQLKFETKISAETKSWVDPLSIKRANKSV